MPIGEHGISLDLPRRIPSHQNRYLSLILNPLLGDQRLGPQDLQCIIPLSRIADPKLTLAIIPP